MKTLPIVGCTLFGAVLYYWYVRYQADYKGGCLAQFQATWNLVQELDGESLRDLKVVKSDGSSTNVSTRSYLVTRLSCNSNKRLVRLVFSRADGQTVLSCQAYDGHFVCEMGGQHVYFKTQSGTRLP